MLLVIKAVETKHFTFTVTPNISCIILVGVKKEKLCFDTNKLIITLITKAIIFSRKPLRGKLLLLHTLHLQPTIIHHCRQLHYLLHKHYPHTKLSVCGYTPTFLPSWLNSTGCLPLQGVLERQACGWLQCFPCPLKRLRYHARRECKMPR